MKKSLLPLLTLFVFSAYAQNCADRVTCSDNMVTVFLIDGGKYTWGLNNWGQLGNGTNTSQITPEPTTNADDWADISHARMHTIALKPDGTIWAWGNNSVAQLGDGTLVDSNVPVQVGAESDWAVISAGNLHSVALKSDGTFWGWGNSAALELGDEEYYTLPVQISDDTDWAKIYAGYFKTYGIKTNGTLWGRGQNLYGSLGVGNPGNIAIFTQVGTDSDWAKVSCARENHTLALKTNGTLWAWGNNQNGKLGIGSTVNQISPVQVGNDQWKDIATGNFHSLGIKADGTLWQWGSYGLIDGGLLIPNSNVPMQVGTDSDWKSIAAGYSSSYAIKEDNSVWAWGYNGGGWLGDGSTTSVANPMKIIDCVTLGTDETAFQNPVIYPNPAHDVLHWAHIGTVSHYKIIDAVGQIVKSGTAEANEIDLSPLSSGLYIIVLDSPNGKIFRQKFVKE